jgi:hypothetical protein
LADAGKIHRDLTSGLEIVSMPAFSRAIAKRTGENHEKL